MSSEKQSKMPEWKESFLQWEQSGGNVASQEGMLWEKLQDRLQPKRKKRGFYFFRAAALIVVVTGLYFLLRKNENAVTPAVVVGQAPGAVVKEGVAIATVPLGYAAPVKSVENIVSEKKPAKVVIPSTLVKEEVVVLPESISPAETPVANVVEKQESVLPPIATVASPKRKLKVVHLNELNAPPPPTYATLKEDWRPFTQPEPEENNVMAPSIWPGKNKHKPTTVLLGN